MSSDELEKGVIRLTVGWLTGWTVCLLPAGLMAVLVLFSVGGDAAYFVLAGGAVAAAAGASTNEVSVL